MKKKILINSISAALFCLMLFLVSSKNALIAAEIDESKIKYVAAKSGLNLRSEPGKTSKIVTLIPFGAKVTIEKSEGSEIFLDGRYGRWVNVKHADKTGWVFSGFLCDFEPNTIKKPAADFYRDYFRKLADSEKDKWLSKEYRELTKIKDNQISVKNIFDDYIILEIPSDWRKDNNVIWKYDANQKKFFEAHKGGSQERATLLYIDKDRYPDLVITKGRSTEAIGIEILLGSEKGFVKIYDSFDFRCCDMHDGYYLSIGSCGDMEFAYGLGRFQEDGDVMHFFRFDCNSRKLEKYAESKIIVFEGIITSIDRENKSLIIKDKKNLKDTSYKIYDKSYYASDEGLKYLEKLQKNKKVIPLDYVIINGEKIIVGIDRDY